MITLNKHFLILTLWLNHNIDLSYGKHIKVVYGCSQRNIHGPLHCLRFVHWSDIQPVSRKQCGRRLCSTCSLLLWHLQLDYTDLFPFPPSHLTNCPLLSCLTWGASGREMPGTWECLNCWAGCWSNCPAPETLRVCFGMSYPFTGPKKIKLGIEKSKLQYPPNIVFWIPVILCSWVVDMLWQGTGHRPVRLCVWIVLSLCVIQSCTHWFVIAIVQQLTVRWGNSSDLN